MKTPHHARSVALWRIPCLALLLPACDQSSPSSPTSSSSPGNKASQAALEAVAPLRKEFNSLLEEYHQAHLTITDEATGRAAIEKMQIIVPKLLALKEKAPPLTTLGDVLLMKKLAEQSAANPAPMRMLISNSALRGDYMKISADYLQALEVKLP